MRIFLQPEPRKIPLQSRPLHRKHDLRVLRKKRLRHIISLAGLSVHGHAPAAALLPVGIFDRYVQPPAAEILFDLKFLPVRRNGRSDLYTVEVRTHAEDTLYAADHDRGGRTRQPVHVRPSRVRARLALRELPVAVRLDDADLGPVILHGRSIFAEVGKCAVSASHQRFRKDQPSLCLGKNPRIFLPKLRDNANHVWHQFVVRTENRDALQKHFAAHNTQTIIHYPVPPHLAECYARLGYKKGMLPIAEKYADQVLSVPMFNGMREDEIEYVIQLCNDWT